jgi:Cys-tRNA(Pro)/Cys-tRNA(Cys) deacylase
MPKKVHTQAMRVLDAHKITYVVHLFPDTIHDAIEVAQHIGLPPQQVFKTLVVLSDDLNSHPMLVMIPADQELDLRQFAHEISVKSVHMARHDQAEKLTGLKVGGISALALLNRNFNIYIDQSVTIFQRIAISAAQRGINLEIAVNDLLKLTNAQPIEATRPKNKEVSE